MAPRPVRLQRSDAAPGPVRHDVTSKLAVRLAERLVDDIAALGWPEGRVIGSEPELIERYGVSRAIFREAVRLVEHQQVARMRRGPGGGLVVTTPTLESVIEPTAIYLFWARTRVEQVAEARIALEEVAAELAADRLTEEAIRDLRRQIELERSHATDDPRDFHATLAGITGNPALELFVALLARIMRMYLPDMTRIGRDVAQDARTAHVRIAEAVLAGDGHLARRRMRTHLTAEAAYMLRSRKTPKLLDAHLLGSLDAKNKRAEHVARQLFLEVTGAGWPVGALLGSETELIERLDVSRAVFREAIRFLEVQQVTSMRRGPGGGLFVVQPSIDPAVDAIAMLLERGGIRRRHLFELREAVELLVVELALRSLDDAGRTMLADALDAEVATPSAEIGDVGHDLHAVLASMVDNPVVELLARVLIRLTRRHMRPGDAPQSMDAFAADVLLAHRAIVDAILVGDVELARHRMRRHMEALRPFARPLPNAPSKKDRATSG